MEIVPEMWKPWQAGNEIVFKVLFRGNPEPSTVLDVAYSNTIDYRQWKAIGGEDGRIRIQAKDPGRYLVVARREVQERVYDSLSLTATLSFLVTK